LFIKPEDVVEKTIIIRGPRFRRIEGQTPTGKNIVRYRYDPNLSRKVAYDKTVKSNWKIVSPKTKQVIRTVPVMYYIGNVTYRDNNPKHKAYGQIVTRKGVVTWVKLEK
jgi:hypothetical protein